MEYYSATKRNKAVIHARIWMNPGNIMLSFMRTVTETTHCMTPLNMQHPDYTNPQKQIEGEWLPGRDSEINYKWHERSC